MFRLQVRYGRSWKWGLNVYNTLEDAQKRVEELNKVGIKSRIKKNEELFN